MTPSNVRKCPLCQQGTALDHEFCDRCGRRIADHCLECGAERTGRGAFCVKCGHEFKIVPAAASGSGQPDGASPVTPMANEPPEPFFPVWFKRVILGAVILLVVSGLGFWLTVWFQRQWAELGVSEPEVTATVPVVKPTAPGGAGVSPPSTQPIVIPDRMPNFSKDSRWQARFEQEYVAYLPKFKPLPLGSPLEVETRTGVRMTGTLWAISNRLVTLSRAGMEIGVEASQLTLTTLSQLFREEYAQVQAATVVEREQQNEGQRQILRNVSGTRQATRPEIKPSSPSGPVAAAKHQTEFQTDMGIFKRSMVRLVISLLVIVGAVVVVRHLW